MSNSIIVTAPASTGITAIRRNAVISHVQTKRGIFINVMPGARMLSIVAMILMLPMMDEAPIKCTANMKYVVEGGP